MVNTERKSSMQLFNAALTEWLNENLTHAPQAGAEHAGLRMPDKDELSWLNYAVSILEDESALRKPLLEIGSCYASLEYGQRNLRVPVDFRKRLERFLYLHPLPVTAIKSSAATHTTFYYDAAKALVRNNNAVTMPLADVDVWQAEITEHVSPAESKYLAVKDVNRIASPSPDDRNTLYYISGTAGYAGEAGIDSDAGESVDRMVKSNLRYAWSLCDSPPGLNVRGIFKYPTRHATDDQLNKHDYNRQSLTYCSDEASAFVTRFLLPHMSRRSESGALYKLDDITPALQAFSNINLLGYSHGGTVVGEINNALVNAMQGLGYSHEQMLDLTGALAAATFGQNTPLVDKPYGIPTLYVTSASDNVVLANMQKGITRNSPAGIKKHKNVEHAFSRGNLYVQSPHSWPMLFSSVITTSFVKTENKDPENGHAARLYTNLNEFSRDGGNRLMVQQNIAAALLRETLRQFTAHDGKNGIRDSRAILKTMAEKHLSNEAISKASLLVSRNTMFMSKLQGWADDMYIGEATPIETKPSGNSR